MITGTVTIALREVANFLEQSSADRRALDVLRHCPRGAHVVVDLGERTFVSEDAARALHEHDHDLQIEIRGSDPEAVARFVRAARAGSWDAVLR